MLGQEGAGGQNVYVHRLATQMARRGHDVDVFTRAIDGFTEVIPVERGYRLIRLAIGPADYVDRSAMLPYLADFSTGMVRFAAGSQRCYDLIHSHYWLSGYVGMRVAAEWRIPRCHTNHSLGAVKLAATSCSPADFTERLAIERAVLQSADRVIATAPQEVDEIRSLYQVLPKLRQIPCGVDTDLFRPLDQDQARAALSIAPDAAVLAYVGRFDPQKGVDTLLRAAACLQSEIPIRLLLAGGSCTGGPDRDERQRLQALAAELGLTAQVRYLGPCTQEQLPLVYAAADVVAIPSTYESFGITAIEAMACARPVVAHRVGGLAHSVVDGRTGLLVAPHQPDVFARACASLFGNPKLRAAMGTNGRQRVIESYAWRHVAIQMEATYAELTAAISHRQERIG
jgi:glycosyltransferase involved in cell wall biosynthesis